MQIFQTGKEAVAEIQLTPNSVNPVMGTIYHVCGVWPPPFCMDCLIFCISIPVSHTLESQHFVFELFFYYISVKRQCFLICLEEDLGLQSQYVAQPHYLCWSVSFISCHIFRNFNIYSDIASTHVWPIAPLKWSGILKICLCTSTSALFQ